MQTQRHTDKQDDTNANDLVIRNVIVDPRPSSRKLTPKTELSLKFTRRKREKKTKTAINSMWTELLLNHISKQRAIQTDIASVQYIECCFTILSDHG